MRGGCKAPWHARVKIVVDPRGVLGYSLACQWVLSRSLPVAPQVVQPAGSFAFLASEAQPALVKQRGPRSRP